MDINSWMYNPSLMSLAIAMLILGIYSGMYLHARIMRERLSEILGTTPLTKVIFLLNGEKPIGKTLISSLWNLGVMCLALSITVLIVVLPFIAIVDFLFNSFTTNEWVWTKIFTISAVAPMLTGFGGYLVVIMAYHLTCLVVATFIEIVSIKRLWYTTVVLFFVVVGYYFYCEGVFDSIIDKPIQHAASAAMVTDESASDIVENDTDNDGVADEIDNCPKANNPGQDDLDADGIGNMCDPDIDGDNVGVPLDCDELNPNRNQLLAEQCGDFIDNDCDELVDYLDPDCKDDRIIDCDGDGFGAKGGDCNDKNPKTHPGATELCDDEEDNDCDGSVNESCAHPPQDEKSGAAPEDGQTEENKKVDEDKTPFTCNKWLHALPGSKMKVAKCDGFPPELVLACSYTYDHSNENFRLTGDCQPVE